MTVLLTSTHHLNVLYSVAMSLLQNYYCSIIAVPLPFHGLKCAARGSLKIQDAKKSTKIAISAPSHNFVGLYLRNEGTYRQSEKKLVKHQYLLHMFS